MKVWNGQWLSLHDLASLMGKSYDNVKKMHQQGGLDVPGIRIHCISRRVWVQVEQSVFDSLRVSGE